MSKKKIINPLSITEIQNRVFRGGAYKASRSHLCSHRTRMDLVFPTWPTDGFRICLKRK